MWITIAGIAQGLIVRKGREGGDYPRWELRVVRVANVLCQGGNCLGANFQEIIICEGNCPERNYLESFLLRKSVYLLN